MSTPSALNASIIVVSFNRRDDLREALAALDAETLDRNAAEILVVDDGSTDDTSEMVAAAYPHIRLLQNDSNHGPSFSRNRASREAHGKLLIYLDSDAVPASRWLERLIENDDGNTVLIGAVRDYEGDRLQSGPRRATFIGKSVRCHPSKANTGASCNLAIPKSCFDAIGGFDEELPYYFEDSDLCIRARKAGYNARYLFDAEVRHKGSETKRGHAVWMQERNSTYAMLKAYRNKPLHLLAFTLANTSWAIARATIYMLRGNVSDAAQLIRGNVAGNRRYLSRH